MGNRYIKKNLLFLVIAFISCSLYAQRYKVQIDLGITVPNGVTGEYGELIFSGDNFVGTNGTGGFDDPPLILSLIHI